jgi:hypothetical protein
MAKKRKAKWKKEIIDIRFWLSVIVTVCFSYLITYMILMVSKVNIYSIPSRVIFTILHLIFSFSIFHKVAPIFYGKKVKPLIEIKWGKKFHINFSNG